MKYLRELFHIKYGVNLELVHCDIVTNGIPFVSRTEKNNGISAFVERIDNQETNPAHTISVAVSGSVCSSFYHPYEYYSGRDVYVLTPINKMTEIEMLYYCMAIYQNKFRYNYGRALNKTLPILLVPDQIPDEFRDLALPNAPIIADYIKNS
ncbi:MAG: restriction endonuclease subunit S [Candidatus Symbiobacter sp.]|nr:restriction endonuclease subunit S [Candidatus Symbiobacter sp.]